MMPARSAVPAILLAAAIAPSATAQTLSQRGFVEGRGIFFPQETPNDSTRAVGDLRVRDEVFVKPADWVQFAGGLDIRANSHDQVDDRWHVDVSDRGTRRPRLSVRRLAATLTHGRNTIDVGKQFIRWGKADIVNPTDRFAPRDFVNVVDNEFLAVTAARVTAQAGGETFELVWVPRFTPSRVPLFDQRWSAWPPELGHVRLVDHGAALPRGSQIGGRWSHIGARLEYSLSFFNGFNHLPNIDAQSLPSEIDVMRVYPAIRTYGADTAVPTRWFTLKGETAYFTSRSTSTDEYAIFVVQLERQTGEWVLVGGYAGEVVTVRRSRLRLIAGSRGRSSAARLTRSIPIAVLHSKVPSGRLAVARTRKRNTPGRMGSIGARP